MNYTKHVRNQILPLIALSLSICLTGKASFAEETTQSSTAAKPSFFAKEKWGANYFNYMNGPAFAEASGSSINHYLTLKHKFNKSWALSATLRPDSNFGNGLKPLTIEDPYLKLSYPTIYEAGNVKIFGDLRYFVPVSDASKSANLIGAVTPRLYGTLENGGLSYTYILIPKVFLNTETLPEQKLFSHAHVLASALKLSPFMTLDLAAIPGWTYAREKGVAFNDMPVYPGFTMTFTPSLTLSPYAEIPAFNAKAKTSSIGASISYDLL